MKRLPIARTVFRELMTENFCYVDKTPFIKQLFDESSKYFFLSRPRRFGKSLFLDTLRAAYAGEKELFKNLFLEKNWDWSKKHPVLSMSFGSSNVKNREEMIVIINEQINDIAEDFNIRISNISLTGRFKQLIKNIQLKFKQNVVVLIDEYDKPLLDNITKETASEIREELAGFYSVLKDSEKYLKFVFITGVSKFSKTSIFSKLNNMSDISLKAKYADICGYTQDDLESIFVGYLHDVNLEKVKDWYDGYNFLGSNLYNPYNILLFLNDKSYKSYWFETGTPTFLLELIKKRKFYVPELEEIELSDTQMGEFDINKIELFVLLFETVYLSIKSNDVMISEGLRVRGLV